MSAANRKSDTHNELFVHFAMPAHSCYSHCTAFARQEKPSENPALGFDQAGWWISFAFCMKGDQFSRAVGRKIARRRYFQVANHLHGPEQPTYEELAHMIGVDVS